MIRLHVSDDLRAGAEIELNPGQRRYLVDVMRLGPGAEVLLFNGRDGEWRARLAGGRGAASLEVQTLARPQAGGCDLGLAVALVKRPRLETIIEKAAELGAARVRLMITERAQPIRPNVERLTAIAAEAAEQTGRMDVPAIEAPISLSSILESWPGDRFLMFCDEAGEAPPLVDALGDAPSGGWAVMIGPEGGFSAAERAAVRALPQTRPVSLGPRILRADTAAIAALSLWQAILGDWRGA
ncbi:MAG TPA: 16S rRNA (uracil(1498)-N(3))-methyltransferase [Caulobacteraceae bacterium]|nr:16S rRNA (uracil(1498)-N(3))-methyltransferase [Caulobacteraceae bacterium]